MNFVQFGDHIINMDQVTVIKRCHKLPYGYDELPYEFHFAASEGFEDEMSQVCWRIEAKHVTPWLHQNGFIIPESEETQ